MMLPGVRHPLAHLIPPRQQQQQEKTEVKEEAAVLPASSGWLLFQRAFLELLCLPMRDAPGDIQAEIVEEEIQEEVQLEEEIQVEEEVQSEEGKEVIQAEEGKEVIQAEEGEEEVQSSQTAIKTEINEEGEIEIIFEKEEDCNDDDDDYEYAEVILAKIEGRRQSAHVKPGIGRPSLRRLLRRLLK